MDEGPSQEFSSCRGREGKGTVLLGLKEMEGEWEGEISDARFVCSFISLLLTENA